MHEVGRGRLATLGCLVAAGLVLAACGGSSHSASASTTPSSGATSTTTAGGGNARGGAAAAAALTAFRTCMSSHGVTVTIPTGNRNRNGGTPPSTTPGGTRPPRPAGGFGGAGGFANRFATAPAGVDKTKYAAAYTACKSKLPTFNGLGGAGGANNSAFQAYRSCLSDHGVTFPTTGGAAGGGTGINRNDPKVAAALKTCAPLLPAGGFGRSTTTTTQPA